MFSQKIILVVFSFFFFYIFSYSQTQNISNNSYKTKNEILDCINRFFEAFRNGDTSKLLKEIEPNLRLETIVSRNGETRVIKETVNDFLKVVGAPRKYSWEEKIISANVEVDGAFANAWCKYIFYTDTVFSHCGIDNIQLCNKNGSWKIFALQDTRNTGANCESYLPREIYDEESISIFLSPITEAKETINSVLNQWHNAAATGDENMFFGSMENACIYLGTDKTEYWTKNEFEKWSKKYFEKDKAWEFKPYNRNIYFTNDMYYAWFDELLETWMGVCRGSGVLHYENGNWKLIHYNLALTCPNEKMKQFVKINK